MEDIQSVGDHKYIRADKIRRLSAFERLALTWNILTTLVPNVIFAFALATYSVLKTVFHLVVPKSLNNIRGQLAVVTGGSNGIGREICLQLAMDGCNVAVLDLDAHGAERTCCDIRQFGVTAMPYKIDVGDYNQVVAVKKLIDRDMGACDILVNNAGLMPKLSLREGQPEDIARILNVNVASHFWMVRVFIEDMIARRRGHIVAIASMIAFYPTSQAIAYTTTKFAVKGFMEALNQEIRDEGYAIKTSTIFPHFVNTRKEVVEYVRDMLGSAALEKVGILTPKQVGRATVAAIRSGSKYASVPWYYLGLGKLFVSVPTSWQDIIIERVMPQRIKRETESN